jgi:hypothetical protein
MITIFGRKYIILTDLKERIRKKKRIEQQTCAYSCILFERIENTAIKCNSVSLKLKSTED